MQTFKLVQTGRISKSSPRYSHPLQVTDLLEKEMSRFDREHFMVLHLNTKHQMIARETISIGSLDTSVVHPREVFKSAVHNGSHSLILVHNHPSGDPNPSMNDLSLTHRLRQAAEIMGIMILDHIIIGNNNYFSLVEYERDFETSKKEAEKIRKETDRRLRAAGFHKVDIAKRKGARA